MHVPFFCKATYNFGISFFLAGHYIGVLCKNDRTGKSSEVGIWTNGYGYGGIENKTTCICDVTSDSNSSVIEVTKHDVNLTGSQTVEIRSQNNVSEMTLNKIYRVSDVGSTTNITDASNLTVHWNNPTNVAGSVFLGFRGRVLLYHNWHKYFLAHEIAQINVKRN